MSDAGLPDSQPFSRPIDLNALLDSGPWTWRQKSVVLLAALAVMFDGMDIQIMGFAVPAIARTWAISKASFAPVLAAGLFGVTIGTFLGGIVGDRFGRRAAILFNVLLFASATLLAATASSVMLLAVARFFAGLGIGGVLPNAATLTAEYTPMSRRPVAVTSTIICIPVGGLLAGVVASHLLPHHSWKLLFVVAGGAPLLLLFLLVFYLPESPRFLAASSSRRPELERAMARIGRSIPADATLLENTHQASPNGAIVEIFRGGLAGDTIPLWVAFFLCLASVYLAVNWLPSILTGMGLNLQQASNGLTYYNLGGIFGALSLGVWINFRGSRLPMMLGSVGAILSGCLAALVLASPHPAIGVLFLLIAFLGLFVNAVQTTLYALAAHVYETRIRSTGVASALAVGRVGAIVSALLGSAVLRLSGSHYFLLLSLAMSGVLFALAALRTHIQRPALLEVEQPAFSD